MADANPTRVGQNLGAGSDRALFKDIFLTEVLAAFQAATVTENAFMTRDITAGRSAQFPVSGLVAGGYHVPGSEIVGGTSEHTLKSITIDEDGMLIAPSFIPSIDELMNFYDVRQVYSAAQGKFMAKLQDLTLLMVALKAARAPANIPGHTQPGNKVVDAAMLTDANKLAAGIFAAATTFSDNGNDEDATAYLKPAQVALLVQNKDAINKFWTTDNGSYNEGTVFRVGGVAIQKTPNLPRLDFTDGATIDANVKALFGPEATAGMLPARYRVNAANTAGVVSTKSALGLVRLAGLQLEENYDFRRKGTLIVSSRVQGADVLRPESSIELATA